MKADLGFIKVGTWQHCVMSPSIVIAALITDLRPVFAEFVTRRVVVAPHAVPSIRGSKNPAQGAQRRLFSIVDSIINDDV